MEADALHDLTAAYALDALDPEDARRTKHTSRIASAVTTSLRALRDGRRTRLRDRGTGAASRAAGPHPRTGQGRAAERRTPAAALGPARHRRRRGSSLRGDRPRPLGGIPVGQARSQERSRAGGPAACGADPRGAGLAQDLVLARDARRGSRRARRSGRLNKLGRLLGRTAPTKRGSAEAGLHSPPACSREGTTSRVCHSTAGAGRGDRDGHREKAGGDEAPSQAPFLIVRNAPQS